MILVQLILKEVMCLRFAAEIVTAFVKSFSVECKKLLTTLQPISSLSLTITRIMK